MATRIFNGTPSATIINNTAYCNGAAALYMIAPDTVAELEIDFYLQLELSPTTNRLVRLNESFVLDTVVVYPIPQELQLIDFNIYGAFTTSLADYIEIWAIYNAITLRNLEEKLNQIKAQQDQHFALEIAQTINELQQNTALALLSGSLSVITTGSSLSAIPPLTGGTTALLPFTGNLFLP